MHETDSVSGNCGWQKQQQRINKEYFNIAFDVQNECKYCDDEFSMSDIVFGVLSPTQMYKFVCNWMNEI